MLETTQKVSRIARYLGCVGRSDLLRAALQALKTKVVAARQAGAAPSPRPSAALTHQSFVNNRTRLLQRGKVKAQFPCLTISEILHQD